MKRNSPVSALLVLAVVLVAALTSGFANKAEAQGSVALPISRILPCKRTVSAAYVDSTVFTIAARTTSEPPDTLLIDTSDWDWAGALGAAATNSSYAPAFVNFSVAGVGGVASGIDSLHCQYQTSANGTTWSAVGNCALVTWNNSDVYARMPILADSDALNASSLFGQKFLRIIVCGDTGGKLGGITASLTYWPKGDVRVANNPDASFR